jgi:hypothetical protein
MASKKAVKIKPTNTHRNIVLIVSVAAFVAAGGLAVLYLMPEFPAGIASAAKPTLSEGQPVGKEHVEWVVSELATDKIRTTYFSAKKMEIEFLVTPENKYFTARVEVYRPQVYEGRASDPDVRLTVGREVVSRLLSADDFFAEVVKLDSEGKIAVEVVRSEEELRSMGYYNIYEELTGKSL